MFKGYSLNASDLALVYESHTNAQARLFLWPAIPQTGLAVIDGTVFAPDTSEPALVVDQGGRARIVKGGAVSLSDLKTAKVAVSGVAQVLTGGSPYPQTGSPAVLTVAGVKGFSEIFMFVLINVTYRQAGLVAKSLGCSDAIVLWEGWHPSQHYAGVGAVKATATPAKILVIDPGHGGTDPGGASLGTLEKNLTMIEARGLVNRLSKYDVLLLPTRSLEKDETMSLRDRTDLANAVGASAVLSLHHNAWLGRGRGYEDFTYNNKGTLDDNSTIRVKDTREDVRFQKIIHGKIRPILDKYQIVDRGMKQDDFRLVRMPDAPSVLVEWLFMDHPEEIKLIEDPLIRGEYLDALAAACVEFLDLKLREPASKLYRVQVGAFSQKENAEAMLQRLKAAGFDGFIVES